MHSIKKKNSSNKIIKAITPKTDKKDNNTKASTSAQISFPEKTKKRKHIPNDSEFENTETKKIKHISNTKNLYQT